MKDMLSFSRQLFKIGINFDNKTLKYREVDCGIKLLRFQEVLIVFMEVQGEILLDR